MHASCYDCSIVHVSAIHNSHRHTQLNDCLHAYMARVFRVSRNGWSLVGDTSSSNSSDGLPPLEICYHTKEAWNIFEVCISLYVIHTYPPIYSCTDSQATLHHSIHLLSNYFVPPPCHYPPVVSYALCPAQASLPAPRVSGGGADDRGGVSARGPASAVHGQWWTVETHVRVPFR